jgi:hypothetical protein
MDPRPRLACRVMPHRVLESAAVTDTAPGAEKRVYPAGPAQVPAGYHIPADTAELDYHDVAVLLTYLGRPTAESTLRSYKRNGNMPVPDFQLGGRDPEPGEKIKCWAKGPRERDPQPGERIGSVNRWRASTIIAWNDTRKGGGFWRETTGARSTTDTRAPRKVKRAEDQNDAGSRAQPRPG